MRNAGKVSFLQNDVELLSQECFHSTGLGGIMLAYSSKQGDLDEIGTD